MKHDVSANNEQLSEEIELLEGDLAVARAAFETLADIAPIGIFCTDDTGNCTYVNRRWCEIAGLELEQALGLGWTWALHADDREWVVGSWTAAAASRGAFSAQFRMQRLDGATSWVVCEAVELRAEDGAQGGWLGYITDITALKSAESARFESEQRLRAVFDSMFQFLGLLTPTGTVIEVNRATVQNGGVPLRDIVGKPLSELRWWNLGDARVRLRRALEEAMAGKFVRYEVDVLAANDDVITIDFSLMPVFDERGRLVYIIPEGRDITETRAAERTATAIAAQFRATFEQAAVGMAHLDATSRFLRVNSRLCAIVGRTHDELAHMSLREITHPDDVVTPEVMNEIVRGRTKSFQAERRHIRKDGRIVWVQTTLSFVRDDAGDFQYAVLVVEDIHARKLTDLALRILGVARRGERFIDWAASRLAELFESDFVFVARRADAPGGGGRPASALVHRDGSRHAHLGSLDSPLLETAMRDGAFIVMRDLEARYPNDRLVAGRGADALVAIALVDPDERTIGVLAVLLRHPIENADLVEALVRSFGPRVAAELSELSELSELAT